MSEPYQGEVISWTHSFGFIRPDGAAQDLFFHVSHTVSGEWVRRGARVLYSIPSRVTEGPISNWR